MRSTRSSVLAVVGAVVLAALASLALPEPAHACSCAGSGSPKNALREADAVFFGKVTAMTIDQRHPEQISSADPVLVEFNVSRVWKGPLRETMTVETERMGISCGYEFAVGHRYVVYAYDGHTGLCTRTRTMWLAARDFAALGLGERPKSAMQEEGSAAPRGTCNAPGHADRNRTDLAAIASIAGVVALSAWRKRGL